MAQEYRIFCKIMLKTELQNGELRIPKRFVNLYWDRIPNPIFLKLPNGAHEWKIVWVKRDGNIWFQKGFEKLAKFLEYGYLLVFSYLQGPYFEVKMVDRTLVEIDYSKMKFVEEEDEVKEEKCDEYDDDEAEGATSRRKKAPKRKSNDNQENVTIAAKKEKKCFPTETDMNSHSIENPSFEIILSQTYVKQFLIIPRWFSRKHMKDLEGIAIIRAAHDMSNPLKVNISLSASDERSRFTTGWNEFTQRYNLQVNDSCEFVMTQKDPVSFTINIQRAQVQICSQKLHDSQGLKKVVKKNNDVVNDNTFMITIASTSYPHIPKRFMEKHKRCHGKEVKLKLRGQSWDVNMTYYENAGGTGRFYGGWPKFVNGCNLKIGDSCFFELVDEEKLVFYVSLIRQNQKN